MEPLNYIIFTNDLQELLSVIAKKEISNLSLLLYKRRIGNAKSLINAAAFKRINTVSVTLIFATLISIILDTFLTFLTPKKEEYFISVEIRT